MGERHIVVIGGVAAGPKAAARARRRDPHAEITIIEKGDLLSYAGCGMPYYISGEIETADELMSSASGGVRDEAFFKNVKAINAMSRTLAERIDREGKFVEAIAVETGERSRVPYDSLVLATGASAVMPPFPGGDLNGVYRLNHPHDAEGIRKAVTDGCGKATIIGAGLIGMEVAEALAAQGLRVTVIEMQQWTVPTLLDRDMAAHLENHLAQKGVQVLTSTRVTAIEGDDRGVVTKVVTDRGEVDTDLVLVSIGVRPTTKLAVDAGLEIGRIGGIKVNERLQTSDPDIYAGGDCVENINRITGAPVYAPLGSTANKHGRIIGDNVTGGDSTFGGVLGTAVFKAFDFNVGRTGLSEGECQAHGIPYVTALTPGPDRAHYYPASKPIIMKVVSHADTGKLLGIQAVGPGDVVKRVDVAATAMTFCADTRDLAELDLGYAPPFSSAVDVLAHASNVIDNKVTGIARAITPEEVKRKIDAGEDFVLLDVRTPHEVEASALVDPRVVHIPLGKLIERAEELPRDKEIIAYCAMSVRGYEAQRILDGKGFKNVVFMDGGLMGWPYPLNSD